MAGLASWGISLGNILEIIIFIVGALAAVLTMRFDIRLLKESIREITNNQDVLDKKFQEFQLSVSEQIDTAEREFGESLAAYREKIVQVEFYLRDNFVRRDTFHALVQELKTNVNVLGDKIDVRLSKIENRLTDNPRRGGQG